MKFKYWKLPAGEKPSIPLPIIEVELMTKFGFFNYPCLIDSGADWCFWHAKEIGEDLLSLNIREGEKIKKVRGITGAELEAYLHKIKFKIGGWEYEEKIAFAYNLNVPFGILGRQGFFNLFREVCFNQNKKEIKIRLFVE